VQNKEKYKQQKKVYVGTKRGHLTRFLAKTRERAVAQNLPHDIDLEHLESIATDECPVFKTPFVWGQGKGRHPYRPSVDRIIPELGYVKGNVVFISLKANVIKQDVTEKELYAVADWLHEARKKVNVKENTAAPVPTGDHPEGDFNTKYGALFTAGFGQDHHYSYYHSGAVQGQDIDHRAQESSGDSVGHGSQEVGTSFTITSIQIDGEPKPKISWIKLGGGHLPDKS
jgi:hypothetical protein